MATFKNLQPGSFSPHGPMVRSANVLNTGEASTISGYLTRTGAGIIHGVRSIKLYDKDLNLVTSVTTSGKPVPFERMDFILNAAGSSGDNGSTDLVINWNCAPAEFSTFSIVIDHHGALGSAILVEVLLAPGQSVAEWRGNGAAKMLWSGELI